MLKFYRHEKCRECDQIQERIEELVLAHQVFTDKKTLPAEDNLPQNAEPPLLLDDSDTFEGKKQIFKHLDDLEKFKAEWDKFQSDSCYCDEDGNME